MFQLLVIAILVTANLADDGIEDLKSLKEQLEGLGNLVIEPPQTRKRESPPDDMIHDLLALLHQERAITQKRYSDLPVKREGKEEQAEDIKDNKTDNEESCKDERDDCDALKPVYSCNHLTMKLKCAKSCKICYPCSDTVDQKICAHFVKLKFCDYKPMVGRMKDLCYKSCGFCRTPSPPACLSSTHGCCWDKSTTKEDSKGSNCPPCIQKRPKVCKTFMPACQSKKEAGRWMRKNCPITCNLCECKDDEDSSKLCEQIVQNGNCKTSDFPKMFCKKSCGLC